MNYKSRNKSTEHAILEVLNNRQSLPPKSKQHYFNLRRGYEGELKFDSFLLNLDNDCIVLNDLLLRTKTTTYQIDSLIITQHKIFLYEIKNFKGDFIYENEKLFKKPTTEVLNPIHQLGRTESLLRQLLSSLKCNLPIHPFIVFIHPEFFMYQAPPDQPFIFPTQITNHLDRFSETPSILTNNHKDLAKQLLSLHIDKSPFTQIPDYRFDQLKKGMTCFDCSVFMNVNEKYKVICKKCNREEDFEQAVLRSIEEFMILFPNDKLTTKTISVWCNLTAERRVRNILRDHFKIVGERRWTHFERR